jgi:hypothetical protein
MSSLHDSEPISPEYRKPKSDCRGEQRPRGTVYQPHIIFEKRFEQMTGTKNSYRVIVGLALVLGIGSLAACGGPDQQTTTTRTVTTDRSYGGPAAPAQQTTTVQRTTTTAP